MEAILLKEWGNMVKSDMEIPKAQNGKIVIKVIYAGVCGSDVTVYSGKHPTATAPVILGHEILGEIAEIGDGVSDEFKLGDKVTVNPLISCGVCEACLGGHKHVCKSLKLLGIHENGGYAQYTVANADMVVKVSADVRDEVAALAEPFAVGYHVVSRSELKVGQTALVIGGGHIGTVIAEVARAAGASKVVISEPNDARRALAESLGFEVINPVKEDVTEKICELVGTNGFDVVFETSGSKAGILLTTAACKIHGTIVPLSLSGAAAEFCLGTVSFKEQRVIGSRVYPYLDFVKGVRLLEKLSKTEDLSKLVSDILPLSEAEKAIDFMINGTNTGKILLKCN